MHRYISTLIAAILLYSPVQAEDRPANRTVTVYGSSTLSCADWVRDAKITRTKQTKSASHTARLNHYRNSYFLLGFVTASNTYGTSIDVSPNDVILYALKYCVEHPKDDIYAATIATRDHFVVKVLDADK